MATNNLYTTKTAALKATKADINKLNVKKLFLGEENILDIINRATPTIKHANDIRETVTENDLWGQWVETKSDGTIVVHDDAVTNPNASSSSAWFSNVKAVQDNKAYSEITTDADGKFTGVVEDSVLANIQIERIKDGTYMFYYCKSLKFFSGDLSSLVNGDSMFDLTSITSFSSDLSSLTNGGGMFYRTPLTSFSGNLSNLTTGSYMFGNTSLTSFDSDLSSLTNGTSMFRTCKNLTSFSSDLSSLTDGWYMFQDTSLTSFSSDLSSLTNGKEMFYSSKLESFSSDLSSLVNGEYMFGITNLTSFSSDLSSLVNGKDMFSNSELESFSSDLSSLVNGTDMFYKNSLTPQSVMYIVESIRNITEEKSKYISGKIPWVTYNANTRKYSAPFGFMEDGSYAYTYNNPNPYTTTIFPQNVGKLNLCIDVTNDPDTIEQQLQTFAEGCLCDSWEELKQEFVDKGWTVTWQYGGTTDVIPNEFPNN